MQDNNKKNVFRIYGIFLTIMLFFSFTLIGLIKISNNSWNTGLKNGISEVLRTNTPDVWVLGNPIRLKSGFSTSAGLFELRNKDSAEKYYAIIIRTPTIYGHIPAVFIYSKNKGAEFAGYSNVKGKVKTILEGNSTDLAVTFWIERIPEIIEKALEEN